MKFKKKVSKKELIDSLKDSIRKNRDALVYITCQKNRLLDALKFNENDLIAKDEYRNVCYIEFCLKFLYVQYKDSLSSMGVK